MVSELLHKAKNFMYLKILFQTLGKWSMRCIGSLEQHQLYQTIVVKSERRKKMEERRKMGICRVAGFGTRDRVRRGRDIRVDLLHLCIMPALVVQTSNQDVSRQPPFGGLLGTCNLEEILWYTQNLQEGLYTKYGLRAPQDSSDGTASRSPMKS